MCMCVLTYLLVFLHILKSLNIHLALTALEFVELYPTYPYFDMTLLLCLQAKTVQEYKYEEMPVKFVRTSSSKKGAKPHV